jgi:CheY-like chemotaxis protein
MENRRFIGFNDYDSAQKMICENVDRLLAKSPSDSSEETQFEKRGDLFLGEVQFRSSHGDFFARGFGKNLNRMMKNLTQSLDRQIQKWRGFRETLMENPKAKPIEAPRNFKNKSVLIIDDDRDSILLLELGLEKMGCKIRFVSDSRQASEALANESYDLIILDWMMPDMNGGDTIAHADKLIASDSLVKKRKLQGEIPVVICSANKLEQLKNLPDSEYFSYVDFWQKPIHLQNVIKSTTKILTSQS